MNKALYFLVSCFVCANVLLQNGARGMGSNSTSMSMNNTDHNMTGTEHNGHNMTGTGHNMNKSGHNGHNMNGTGHNGHNMNGTGHNGHNMNGTGHNGHNMNGTEHNGHNMNGTGHNGHNMNGTEHNNHNNGSGHGGHGSGGMDNKHGGHGSSHGTGHQLYFHTTHTNVTFLFKEWTALTETGFSGMCLLLAFLALFYEGLKLCRQYLTRLQVSSKDSGRLFVNKNSGSKLASDVAYKTSLCYKVFLHLVQTFLHVVQIFIGYVLMLAFMTFNAYICVAIMAGFGVGYLMFGWVMPGWAMSYHEHDTCCT